MQPVLDSLKARLKGKILILGIGNTIRGDDGFGSLLAKELEGKIKASVYDAGPSPENYLGKIARENPDIVLIIDAVDFGGVPGQIRLFKPEDFKTANFFTTHNSSILLLINYLKKEINKDILVLAAQPEKTNFGQELSQNLLKAKDVLLNFFIKFLNKKEP